jgi:hypothetical protein
MFAAEIAYRSWVAMNGYRWVRYKDLPEPKGQGIGGLSYDYYRDYPGNSLTEIHSATGQFASRHYRPCEPFKEHPTLYREFAAIPWGDRAAVIAFASQYGMLDSNLMMGTYASSLPEGVHIRRRQSFVPCDPEEDWLVGPAMLRMLIRVWNNENNPTELMDTFRWVGECNKGSWVWHPVPSDGPSLDKDKQGLVPTMIYREWDSPDFIPDDEGKREVNMLPSRPWTGTETLKEVARAFIRQELSKQVGYSQCTLRLKQNADGQTVFQVIPGNMLQAIFMQFGQAYSGNKQHRQCTVCATWFELVPQDKGRKEFCSAACKVKDYRNRKQQAVELRTEGRTPTQIASAIQTPIETVKGWLKSTKNRKAE